MRVSLWFVLLALLPAWACRQDMHDQPRYEPLEASRFFDDHRSARPQVEGTVARGQLELDEAFFQGKVGDEYVDTFPFPITRQVLERGRQRFEIFCTPCHGRLGNGNGMVVQRGFRRPPSYHDERLLESPPGYFFNVITHGFGAMTNYAARVPPRDRWAIVAYIRALQLSRRVPISELTPEEQRRLEEQR